MNSLHHVSLVAVRQMQACCRMETAMEFLPEYPEQLAGITYMYDAMNFYILGKTVTEEGKSVLVLLKSDTGVVTDEMIPIDIPALGEIKLSAAVCEEGTTIRFYYQVFGEDWKQAGGDYTTEIITDEHCRGFTGAHFGLYVHDMAGLSAFADFDYMNMEREAMK